MNLCVNPSEAVCETIAALGEWCIQTLASNPVPLLGLQLAPEQVRERYVSCLKTSEKGLQNAPFEDEQGWAVCSPVLHPWEG